MTAAAAFAAAKAKREEKAKHGTSSSGKGSSHKKIMTSGTTKKDKITFSQIHVTMKTGEPYKSWQVGRVARLTGVLKLQTAMDFYPGW